MKYNATEKYNAVIIDFKGNIMGGPESQEFSNYLHGLLDQGKKNIIVNLSKVKFMNSSGLGMLISAFTTVKNGGGIFKIANATDKINSLLVITKLITVFDHYESVDEAVESLK